MPVDQLCRRILPAFIGDLLGLGPSELDAIGRGRGLLLRAGLGLPGFAEREDVGHYTSLPCSTAAAMKLANSGCGSNGLDLSSGWNCTPMNQGWSVRSTISGSRPSGDTPENRRPFFSSTLR